MKDNSEILHHHKFFFSNKLKQLNLNDYCYICEKPIKIESKNEYLQSLTHAQLSEDVQVKHTIKNPDFSDIDKRFNDYITNHNKKFYLCFVKNDLD